SLLTVALVACASFLILAISAFRLAPSEEGTGGFVLVAQSDQPIHHDLNTPEGRIELGFRSADEKLLDRFRVHALRVHDGEDASCLNLYQTRQPRVLGVPDPAAVLARFAFGDGGAALEEDDATVPAALDFNTAMYSLKLYGGVGSRLTIRDGVDQPVDVEVAGLLKNSILQGDLLVAERDFLELYPATGGYRFFLIEPTAADERNTLADSGELAAMLEDRLSDYGFDAEDAERRLAGFLAVQNTYLSTFQSLGALGLLLGAVGVAVVQLRNLVERRGELALLRAAGFTTGSLRTLILRENLALLVGGLVIGAVAAGVALAPQAWTDDTRTPWGDSLVLLGVIAAIGLLVGSVLTRRAARAPILAALRGD
ncbi:MAG: ABC transporter permease, partial [Planctomycetota bacterium]